MAKKNFRGQTRKKKAKIELFGLKKAKIPTLLTYKCLYCFISLQLTDCTGSHMFKMNLLYITLKYSLIIHKPCGKHVSHNMSCGVTLYLIKLIFISILYTIVHPN